MGFSETIRIAIVGVGNCASSLVQLIHGQLQDGAIGHPLDGAYWPEEDPRETGVDFKVVAAFDIDETKVGQDLSRAINSPANCTSVYRKVPFQAVSVSKGPRLDGIDGALEGKVRVAPGENVDVVSLLRSSGTHIVVNLLPTGAVAATNYYAQAAIDARCAFVNCIPVPVATSSHWEERFTRAQLPVLGDDLKSQLGTTALHQSLVDLIQTKGGRVTKTYQMNIGGNADFMNMTTESRRAFKNRTKTSAVQARVRDLRIPDIGPNGYVPELRDNKRAHVMIEAVVALGMRVELSVNLSVEDSPNAAGVILPAILSCYRAMCGGEFGSVVERCDRFFKMPRPISS